MQIATPIPLTKFVPLAFKGENANRLILMSQKLKTGQQKPLVIFLTHQNLEFPNYGEMPVIIKVIKLPKGRIPSGPEYAEIKRSVFDYLSSFSDPSLIGLCSSRGNDICLYIAARWIIEERSIDPQKVIDDIRNSNPPGIIKRKYIQSISEIYGVQLSLNNQTQVMDYNRKQYQQYGYNQQQKYQNYQQNDRRNHNFIEILNSAPIYPVSPGVQQYAQSPQNIYQRASPQQIPRNQSPPYNQMSPPYAFSASPPQSPPYNSRNYSFSNYEPVSSPPPQNYNRYGSSYSTYRRDEIYQPPPASPPRQPTPNSSTYGVSNDRYQTSQQQQQQQQRPVNYSNPTDNQASRIQSQPEQKTRETTNRSVFRSYSQGKIPNKNSFISFNVDPDDSKLHKKIENEFNDPIIMAIGSSVSQALEKEIRDGINEYINPNSNDFYLKDYYPLNLGTIQNIANDKRCYCFMQQPDGKRCYLFLRGKQAFLVGEPGFIRSVRCFIPDHRDPSQSLVFSIFEGVLYREQNSPNIKFLLCDVILYETVPQHKQPFPKRFQYADTAFNDIVKALKENDQNVKGNDIELQLRLYYRLKYMSYISRKKLPTTKGYVFMPKTALIENFTPIFYFTEFDKPFVSVRIEISNDDNECYGTITEERLKVIHFKTASEGLKRVQGRIVDIEYNFVSKNWSIKCLSKSRHAMSLEEFIRITDATKSGPFTEPRLIEEIEKINKLPQYVQEEMEKQKRVQTQ